MATEDFKRKLTAVMSADVAGYSRLMGEDEADTVQTLNVYKGIMFTLIKQYRGRVIDSPGDNLLAEFASVVDAVQCSVTVQKELQGRNAERSENRRMEFRIGINLGDVIEEQDRIFGDGVNIAARLEALSDPGGICISKTAFDTIETKLPLGYEYLGEKDVKNIAKPVGAFRVLMDAEAAGKVIGDLKPKTKQLRGAAIGGLIVLIIVAGALAIWNFYFRPPFEPASVEKMALPLPDKPSIAVLPFKNMSGDPEQEYFSDGITEEIITALSKTPKVLVIARNSTFSYKDKPAKVRQVSEELGVQFVLEGSVRKAEDQVRITAQLIDALSGHHLWAERYDRKLNDIFAIQDDITMNIITSIQVKLTLGEQGTLIAEGTKNIDAYLHYLQALDHLWQFNKEDNMKARKLAEKTIALDPDYDKGYFVLAFVEIIDVWLGASKSPNEALMRCMELAKKSIAIRDSPIPHRVLAGTYLLFRKHSAAIEEAKKAIEMAPNYADGYNTLGVVYMQSDMGEEAVPVIQKAIRLNPYPPSTYYTSLAWSYCLIGKYDEAIAEGKRAISVNPKDFLAHLCLICAYLSMGREEEARAHAAEILRIDPNFSVDKAERTTPLKNKDKLKRIMEQYRMAGLPD